MYAVEFQSTVQEDGFIKIPNEYKGKIGRNVKVIILTEEQEKIKAFPDFSAVTVSTKDYRFDRENANER